MLVRVKRTVCRIDFVYVDCKSYFYTLIKRQWMIWKKKTDNKIKAFETLFREQYPKMVRYATQILGDKDEACDVVGEAMEQVWKRFDNLVDEQQVPWLFASVRNIALNRIKHRQVEYSHIDALREETVFSLQSGYWEHERLLLKAEAVVDELGEPTKTILRLCYFEKNTYRNVAELLGISPDTVKKHISKALSKLRESIIGKEAINE